MSSVVKEEKLDGPESSKPRKRTKIGGNAGPLDENTLRILFATDNHLGFAEKDPIRGDDSFRAFEEILQMAKDKKANIIFDPCGSVVDFLLLGGDLFHDNKPSRSTLLRTAGLFRKYCLGDGEIKFQIVSDQTVNFPDSECVNYEDPNYNISLPVLCIHGNHDDPAGSGKKSAIDLLSTTRLLNYFGKCDNVDDIEISPILITKGATRVALYGLGNIRDERLHRTFRAGKVKWLKPVQEAEKWFNIFVIHQNRTKHTAFQKNYINESLLPKFLDVVLWAHEHDSYPEPEESLSGQFMVCQPGSSVATSLSAGEALEKHVELMEIRGDDYRFLPQKLQTVRPFCFEDLSLSSYPELDASLEAEQIEHIERILTEVVNERIRKLQAELDDKDREALERGASTAQLPLIRIRVDHTNYPKLNMSRFGAKFVGKVANPSDLLLFNRKRVQQKKSSVTDGGVEVDSILEVEADQAPPIHDIVSSFLKEYTLQVMSESKLAQVVREYVEKQESDAISSFVDLTLKEVQTKLVNEKALTTKDDIDGALARMASARAAARAPAEPESKSRAHKGADLDGEEAKSTRAKTRAVASTSAKEKSVKRSTKSRSKALKKVEDDGDEDAVSDEEDDDEDAPLSSQNRNPKAEKELTSGARSPSRRQPAASAGRKRPSAASKNEDDKAALIADIADSDGDMMVEERPRAGRNQKAAPVPPQSQDSDIASVAFAPKRNLPATSRIMQQVEDLTADDDPEPPSWGPRKAKR